MVKKKIIRGRFWPTAEQTGPQISIERNSAMQRTVELSQVGDGVRLSAHYSPFPNLHAPATIVFASTSTVGDQPETQQTLCHRRRGFSMRDEIHAQGLACRRVIDAQLVTKVWEYSARRRVEECN